MHNSRPLELVKGEPSVLVIRTETPISNHNIESDVFYGFGCNFVDMHELNTSHVYKTSEI
jgi:hypothetical protein